MSIRHQCVTLVKILRCLAYRQVDRQSYAELQELVAILNDPFEKIRGGSSDFADIQQSIKLVRRALRNHMKSLSDVDPRTVTGIVALMDEARKKDEDNARSRGLLSFVKAGGDKRAVEFILYEMGGRKQLWAKHIRTDSNFVDWILDLNKDSGKPRITALDNVHFYISFNTELNGAEHVGLISGHGFRPKRAVSSFQDIQQLEGNFDGRIYALVDRNPQIHVLFLIDTHLLAAFSLAMPIGRKSGRRAPVLKGKKPQWGIDGTLYHIQQLAEELILGKTTVQWRVVYWIDKGMNTIPIEIPVDSTDLSGELSQICDKIIEASKEDRSARWLIEFHLCPISPRTQPALAEFRAWTAFLGYGANPIVQAVVRGAEAVDLSH